MQCIPGAASKEKILENEIKRDISSSSFIQLYIVCTAAASVFLSSPSVRQADRQNGNAVKKASRYLLPFLCSLDKKVLRFCREGFSEGQEVLDCS